MITFLKEVCEDHIREKHPEWILDQSMESGLKSSAAGLSPVSSAQKRFAEDDEESETSTRYNNPDWLKTTKQNFNKLVIEKCSY